VASTPLQKAVKRGDIIAARTLLAEGAEPDSTALMTAVTKGDKPMLRLLLDAGANADSALGHGFTPLVWGRSTVTPRLCGCCWMRVRARLRALRVTRCSTTSRGDATVTGERAKSLACCEPQGRSLVPIGGCVFVGAWMPWSISFGAHSGNERGFREPPWPPPIPLPPPKDPP
jgi:hypothetical protein